MQRRHFKRLLSLNERLEQEAARLSAQAKNFPFGKEREELIHRALQAETGTRIDEWLSSAGLRALQ